MHRFFNIVRFLTFVLFLWSLYLLGSCAPARTILQQANLSPSPVPIQTQRTPTEDDYTRFQTHILGPFIEPSQFELIDSKVISEDWLDGRARVEARSYSVSHGMEAQPFEIIFITPKENLSAPVIITQNFSSNRSVVARKGVSPLPGKARNMGPLGPIFTFFFGRYIVEPPYEDILDAGYAIAVMHPPDYVPDQSKSGDMRLDQMFPNMGDSRPGALNVWASLTTAVAAELKQDQPTRPVIAYGHSRYGKTALIAAASSPDIDGSISHQSGTAGASMMRDKTGESLGDVYRYYPHWLTPGAAEYAENASALPVDAPALLAAIAPKPILLGNARRDVWSDPEGAFRAAKIAAPAWGEKSFEATRLDDFRPVDSIAFWTRPGTHGVTKEDWPAFIAFMDAHFKE